MNTKQKTTAGKTATKQISIPAATLERAAAQAKQTPSEYIADSCRIITGRRVSVRHVETTDGNATFELAHVCNEPPRVLRWRKIAEKRLAQLEELQHPELFLLKTCAEIEGITPADLIVERLKDARGGGENVTEEPPSMCCPDYEAYTDTEYEQAGTVARNNHEREKVNQMIFEFSYVGVCRDMLPGYGEAFLRRWYCPGDFGVRPALERMVADALERCKA